MSTTADAVDRHSDEFRLPLRGGWVVLPRRGTVVTGVLMVIAVVVSLLSLAKGDYELSIGDVVRAVFVGGDDIGTQIVREWRAPRVVAAFVFGGALGVSGAIFQTLTRNPLGSPEVIGFSTGSYTGAIIVFTIIGTSSASVTFGAMVAGLLTALVVYALAYRNGVEGFRLIIVGIAVTTLLNSVNVWLLLRAQEEVAMSASIWGAGTLALIDWGDLVTPAIVLVVLLPAMAGLSNPLRQLELGDDAASAHGVHTERSRLALIVVGVGFIAIVTATTGPIAFVALAAPQLAKGLTGSAGLPLIASAMMGSVLLVTADFAAQHALPDDVPVGLVTLVLGGIYLLGMMIQTSIRRM